MIKSLAELPLLAAYLKRIGAEPVNFRRADVVEMQGKYPKVVGSVRVHLDGSLTCHGCAAPSAAEAEAIAAEIKAAEFPKPVTLQALGNDLPPNFILDGVRGYACHDLQGRIVMLQQRIDLPDGKRYVPWTYFSDGQWRAMEPEGGLPFYGLDRAKDSSSTLFIHEGAKAAAHLQRLVDATAPGTSSALPWETDGEPQEAIQSQGFPWLEEMRWGCHIGWLGGVHALERSDWHTLAKQPWKRVVIIADNDAVGKAVVPRISEHFRCPTFAITWSDEWPEHFDLADKWPSSMFSPEGLYTGRSFPAMLQPATWATDAITIISDTGRPKTVHVIRPGFAEQWAWVATQELVVNLELPRFAYNLGGFNGAVRPFSHVNDTAALLKRHYTGGIGTVTYDPSQPGRVVMDASSGLLAVNQFEPCPVKPVAGDWGLWDEFLAYLIPNELDRHQVKRWAATLAARPATRMIYGLLLMSEAQGIGKSTLGSIMAELVGRTNASFPGENMITGSEFNGWVANKRLIVVGEIYQGHSWKAYNKLKPYVTDPEIDVNIKHRVTYTQPNWCHFILCSNSPAALKLEVADRRWLVPQVVEHPWGKGKFQELHKWLREGGLAIIAEWARTFEERGEGTFVGPGDIAPMSARKARLIDESRSEAEHMLLHLAEQLQAQTEAVAIPLGFMKEWVEEGHKGTMYETPQAMARIMRQAGLWVTPERVKLAGSKQYLILSQEGMLEWPVPKLREAVRKPRELVVEEF